MIYFYLWYHSSSKIGYLKLHPPLPSVWNWFWDQNRPRGILLILQKRAVTTSTEIWTELWPVRVMLANIYQSQYITAVCCSHGFFSRFLSYLCVCLSWHCKPQSSKATTRKMRAFTSNMSWRNSFAWNKMRNGDMVQGCVQPHGENTAWNYKAVSIRERRSSVWIPRRWIETVNPGSIGTVLGGCPICQIYVVSLLGPAIISSLIAQLTIYYTQSTS